MKGSAVTCALMFAVLGAPTAWAGPAEVAELGLRLRDIEAEIRATEGRMRNALQNRSDNAGDEGVHLRTLKRDRDQVKRALQQATAAERQREAASQGMPQARPALDLGPAEQTPKVEVAPSGELVPAPSL